MKNPLSIIAAVLLVTASETLAQGFYIYPNNGKRVEYQYSEVDSIVRFNEGIYICKSDGTKITYKDSETREVVAFHTYMPETGKINGHDYVDLDLPSRTKWATCNVGASSPTQYGNYYAWGVPTTQSSYTFDNYKWKDMDTQTLLSKEVIVEDAFGYQFDLAPQYDAAYKQWGGSWHIPTERQMDELKYYCTWTWTNNYQGSNKGYIVTGRNGNSIFLIAAGKNGINGYTNRGITGYYWNSTTEKRETIDTQLLAFESDFIQMWWRDTSSGLSGCYEGCSIRPVSD